MSGEDTPAQHKSSDSDADIQRLVNQLLKFLPASEHDDAPDALEGCGATTT